MGPGPRPAPQLALAGSGQLWQAAMTYNLLEIGFTIRTVSSRALG